MNELTSTNTDPHSQVQIRPDEPGYMDNLFRVYIKLKDIPRAVQKKFRTMIRQARGMSTCEAFPILYKWFRTKYLPYLCEKNKEPLSDDVVEWLNSYLLDLYDHDKYRDIPDDAVQRVCEFAININTRYSVGEPYILISQTSRIIWLAMLLLGAGGRVFAFSGEAFAETLSHLTGHQVQSMTIYRIIKNIRSSGLITQIKKGRKLGSCGTYKLKDDRCRDWEKIGSTPRDGNSPITADEIRKMFPWIFQTAG